MKKHFKNSISILVALFFFIGAIYTYSSLIGPAYKNIEKLKEEKIQKEEEYKKDKKIFDQTQEFISLYQSQANLQKTISVIFPIEPAISMAVYQINSMAAASGIALKSINSGELSITPSKHQAVAGKGTVRIGARFSGSYEAFKSFIQRLETNSRLFSINSINVNKQPTNPNALDFSLEVDAYYQTAK